jgi:hypothetical protein
MMAEELEKNLGGTYSVLAETLMAPLVRCLMRVFSTEMTNVLDDIVEPTITTGLDAIGRGNDKMRLLQFMTSCSTALTPDGFAQYINPSELIRRLASADGIDVKSLVRTEAQLKAEQDKQTQLQLASQLSQGALNNAAIPPAAATAGTPGPAGPEGAGGPAV